MSNELLVLGAKLIAIMSTLIRFVPYNPNMDCIARLRLVPLVYHVVKQQFQRYFE